MKKREKTAIIRGVVLGVLVSTTLDVLTCSMWGRQASDIMLGWNNGFLVGCVITMLMFAIYTEKIARHLIVIKKKQQRRDNDDDDQDDWWKRGEAAPY